MTESQALGGQSGTFREQGVREVGILDSTGDSPGLKSQCLHLYISSVHLSVIHSFHRQLWSLVRTVCSQVWETNTKADNPKTMCKGQCWGRLGHDGSPEDWHLTQCGEAASPTRLLESLTRVESERVSKSCVQSDAKGSGIRE